MNAPEFDDFAGLWQQRDPEEERVFRALARRVGWRARALHYAEYGLAALIMAAVALALLTDSTPATLAFGLVLAAAVIWEAWRRRLLYETTLINDLSDRETLIAAALKRSRNELGQARSGLILFPVGMFLAALMKFSAVTGGEVQRFAAAFLASVRHGESAAAAMVCLILALLYFAQRSVRLRREVRRFEALQAAYRSEARKDEADRDGR